MFIMPTRSRDGSSPGVSMLVVITLKTIEELGGWQSVICQVEIRSSLEYARLLLQEEVEQDFDVSLDEGCYYEQPLWRGLEPLGLQGRCKVLVWTPGEPGGRVDTWKIPTIAMLHSIGKRITIETEDAH